MTRVEEEAIDLDQTAALPGERLEAEIVHRVGSLARRTHELLLLIGELDARGRWAWAGALSCAAWLADAAELDLATAHSYVRVARAVRAHPPLAAAMAQRSVSYAKARVLVPHLTAENAVELVALAIRVPAADLGRAIAGWSRRNEDPEEIDRRHHRDRSVRWRTDSDGMVTITARLPPQTAGAIAAAVDQRVMSESAPAGASLAQQRADALQAVCTGGGPTVTAEVVVHVDETGSHLPDGTPLSDHAVAALLDEGFVSLLIHDAQRRPIDASPRRRRPTRRQRRVIDARQPTCAEEGCTCRTLLQADHVVAYSRGGPTVLANLTNRCGPHNRDKGAG